VTLSPDLIELFHRAFPRPEQRAALAQAIANGQIIAGDFELELVFDDVPKTCHCPVSHVYGRDRASRAYSSEKGALFEFTVAYDHEFHRRWEALKRERAARGELVPYRFGPDGTGLAGQILQELLNATKTGGVNK